MDTDDTLSTDPLTEVTPDDVQAPPGAADPLADLADIRMPAEIGFWPPAPGWWLLFLVLAVAALWLALRMRRQIHHAWRRRSALQELKRCQRSLEAGGVDALQSQQNYVNAVNSVLRRVALQFHPRAQVASLTGEQWLRFLREHGDASLLDERHATALTQGRFAPRCDIDPTTLHRLAERWIRSQYSSRIDSGSKTAEVATDHA